MAKGRDGRSANRGPANSPGGAGNGEHNPAGNSRRLCLRIIRERAWTPMTPRKREICGDFGVPPREPPIILADGLQFELRPGQIVLLTGPSGAGKTSLLDEIARQLTRAVRVDRLRLPANRSVVDAVVPGRPLAEALAILTACGLGEPRLWLRSAVELSAGERFRALLARSIGAAARSGPGTCSLRLGEGEEHGLGRVGNTEPLVRDPLPLVRESLLAPTIQGNPFPRLHPRPPCPQHQTQYRHPQPILCDEFASLLHRRLARSIACNLRKLVSRLGLVFIAATAHEDLIDDLQPDRIVRLGEAPVAPEDGIRSQPASVRGRILATARSADASDKSLTPPISPHLADALIESGGVRDYDRFAAMHYRRGDALGFVDKIFLLRDRRSGDSLGIVVYAHAPMELAARNMATAGRFAGNLPRLNRELRTLRRLVIHPDVRGCGLGHHLVRETLPRVGVRFVECLATMGAINPVFERAGMSRVGPCPLPRGRMQLLERLRRAGVDPFAPEFEAALARQPRVRALVERTLADWIDRTHGGIAPRMRARRNRHRRRGDSPAGPRHAARLAETFRQIIGRPPAYYLWDRAGEFPIPGAARPCEDASRDDSHERLRHRP